MDDRHPPYEAHIDRILPEVDPQTRTAHFRIVLPHAEALRPEQWVNLVVSLQRRMSLAIPEESVIYTGPERLVFVETTDGGLEKRPLKLGLAADGFVEVLEGLQEGEKVVKSGNFLVSAEARLKAGAAPAPTHE